MRVLISVAASLMLMLALVGPVAATGPGCSYFGEKTAEAGHREMPGFEGQIFGQVVSLVAHGGFASVGFAGVRDLVQWEHGEYCAK